MSILEKLGFISKQEPQPVILQQQPEVKEPDPEPEPLSSQAEWFKPAEGDAKPFEFDPSKIVEVDPKALGEAISKLNFIQGALTPDVMEKIKGGGEDATSATISLMNTVAQQTMQAALQASQKMIETSLAKSAPAFDARMQAYSKSERIERAIKESSPIFQSPASEFMVSALKKAFETKYPNATEAEWKEMATSFATDIVKAGSPKQEDKEEKGLDDVDWGAFLEDRRAG